VISHALVVTSAYPINNVVVWNNPVHCHYTKWSRFWSTPATSRLQYLYHSSSKGINDHLMI